MFDTIKSKIRSVWAEYQLPAAATKERYKDRQGLPPADPGYERVIEEGIRWLGRAQDYSPTQDGGAAHSYSLIKGWLSSYPETTGYIIPTLLDYPSHKDNGEARTKARRMLDWLVNIQLPGGGFQGGRIDSTPIVPVTFNTGQILLGLAAGAKAFGDYLEPMCRAADWLVDTVDSDGCWRRHPTPFAEPGVKTYDTHLAWGLLEAARIEPNRGYAEAALANVRWALGNQKDNGWFEQCCLDDPSRPLTHTLGYALRGILEAYRYSNDQAFLNAATRTADGLLSGLGNDGYLAGRLLPDWKPAVEWVCLTGSVQIANCWLMLFQITKEEVYWRAGCLANQYVRRTINLDGPPEIRGAVKGSFPVDGDYGKYCYLNWAAKFCIDSNMLERAIRKKRAPGFPKNLRTVAEL